MSSKLIVFGLLLFTMFSNPWSTSIEDQLTLYVSKQNKAVDQIYLEKFKTFADQNETYPVIRYIEADGAPEGIAVTPSIVFQNNHGHSLYYGRYRNFSRMKTFVRKSRLKHSQYSITPKKELLVWKDQRATITAPLKVTPMTGDLPSGFDQNSFSQSANVCFAKGMKHFELLPSFDQPKTNRAFYIDIHPHLSKDKTLTLKAEIYSQFNCIRSVYHSMREPLISGKWKNRRQLLETAAELLEAEILNVIKQSADGDDFVTIPVTTKTGNLQLDIAASVVKRNTTPLSETIPRNWKIKQTANSRVPLGAFSFLSPLDGYAGEIKQLAGNFSLNENKGLNDAEGMFSVAIKDITMGEKSFDHEVHYKMLDIKQFPSSTFKFNRVTGGSDQLRLYREEQCTVEGTFTMKGIDIPISVPATMELRLDAEGQYLLHTVATFSLNLFDDFKVKGPDGPSPSRDVLEFVLKFDLENND